MEVFNCQTGPNYRPTTSDLQDFQFHINITDFGKSGFQSRLMAIRHA